MEKRQTGSIIKHFTVLGVGTFVNMLLSLITTPIITRIVDPTENGQFSIFTMYSSVALAVLLLGLDQSLVRYYYIKETTEYRRALMFKCLKYPVFTTIIVSIVFIQFLLTTGIRVEFSIPIYVLLCIYTLIQVLFRFSHNIVRLEFDSKRYSLINILIKGSYVIIALVLLVTIKAHYLLILITATIASTMVGLFYSVIVQKRMWDWKRNNPMECDISNEELLKYGLPLIVSTGMAVLLSAVDKMSLNHYCSYAEVGIYASTLTLVNVFAIIQSTFSILWAPMAIEHYTKNSEDKSFFQKGNQIITIIMFFFGLTLILFKDVFAILLGEKYREAAYILPFLIFHPIMYTISETTVTGIVVMKKSQMQILIGAVALLFNMVGNTVLVPLFAGKGAAIATGVSYIVFYFMRTIISNRYYYVDYKLSRFVLITLITAGYALFSTFKRISWISIALYFISILILIILYKDSFRYCIQYGAEFLKQRLKGR